MKLKKSSDESLRIATKPATAGQDTKTLHKRKGENKMKNIDIIKEFVDGINDYNAVNHIGYRKNKLWNYSTVLADLDRENKIANFNITKYSTTTGRIQNMLRRELENAGYMIEEFTGAAATIWNFGYQGAPTLKKSDFA